jgi:cadmium resistance protein CadD (predicted permease)
MQEKRHCEDYQEQLGQIQTLSSQLKGVIEILGKWGKWGFMALVLLHLGHFYLCVIAIHIPWN